MYFYILKPLPTYTTSFTHSFIEVNPFGYFSHLLKTLWLPVTKGDENQNSFPISIKGTFSLFLGLFYFNPMTSSEYYLSIITEIISVTETRCGLSTNLL